MNQIPKPSGPPRTVPHSGTLVAGTLSIVVVAAGVMSADETVDFNRDIRPILSEKCFTCHGPDENTREGALADVGGYASVVAGEPDASELLSRVTASDADLRMPPEGEPLTAEQIGLLRRWIEQGAFYQRHWSFEPIRRPDPPAIRDRTWPRNPIDHFVLARLEKQQIDPSPEADRYTLIRRVHLDLIGLPPTPDEADAFMNDSSDNAFEQVVDRLLANPHFGERWGRHWLDQARYADSHGYTNDNARTMWPYRDWVIEAFSRRSTTSSTRSSTQRPTGTRCHPPSRFKRHHKSASWNSWTRRLPSSRK